MRPLAIFFILLLSYCKTSSKVITHIDLSKTELRLAPIAKEQFEIIGPVSAEASKQRYLFWEVSEHKNGTLFGSLYDEDFQAGKFIICTASIGLLCPYYDLNARDLAFYNALSKHENADTLLSVTIEEQGTNYFVYEKVRTRVRAIAVSLKSDDQLPAKKEERDEPQKTDNPDSNNEPDTPGKPVQDQRQNN